MSFSDKLLETLRKKAFGFSYTESTLEFEPAKVKPYLFCEKRKRVYCNQGYLKVVKVSGGLEHKERKISRCVPEVLQKFKVYKKI